MRDQQRLGRLGHEPRLRRIWLSNSASTAVRSTATFQHPHPAAGQPNSPAAYRSTPGYALDVGKLNLYYGTVRSATENRHIMAWAKSRKDALDLVEAAMTTSEPVLGSVVGPLARLPDDVMNPGVFVEATPAPKP